MNGYVVLGGFSLVLLIGVALVTNAMASPPPPPVQPNTVGGSAAAGTADGQAGLLLLGQLVQAGGEVYRTERAANTSSPRETTTTATNTSR